MQQPPKPRGSKRERSRKLQWVAGCSALTAGLTLAAVGAAPRNVAPEIRLQNWGLLTSPVYGTSEAGVYASAEKFAGAGKFGGNYYNGVLPNGRIVNPAGISVQIGMNPLGSALTPDGKFLITSNDDERDSNMASLQSAVNKGGYSVSVLRTSDMKVVSQLNFSNAAGGLFIGLQVTGNGPYTAWASGGTSQSIHVFNVAVDGTLSAGGDIPIAPITPANQGYVSNYTPAPAFNTADAQGNKPPVPTGFDRVNGAKITFPAGSALSADGKFLYVACNGDNSLAVINTATRQVVRQVPVGFFPYGVTVSGDGQSVMVSNWGIMPYQFAHPTYDASGKLTSLGQTGPNEPDGYYVPSTNSVQTSSVTFVSVPNGNGAAAAPAGSVYVGKTLDDLKQVGDTHPSALGVVKGKNIQVLYVAKANDDSLELIPIGNPGHDAQARKAGLRTRGAHDDNQGDDNNQGDEGGDLHSRTFDLSPLRGNGADGKSLVGAYPNAIAVSNDGTRVYVAEAGINSVAVLDTTNPLEPKLVGRIGTGWYPTALSLSGDGKTLYIINAKGVGEDINPNTQPASGHPTGQESFSDSNFIFGSAQKVDLTHATLDNVSVLANNFAVQGQVDTSVVPVGGAASSKIKHVFFILHENKTFDTMLGNQSAHFGPFASTTFNNADGTPVTDPQFTPVALNTQAIANKFATAVNYYSDSEESDAGHQFCASGTATDYTEKTLLVKTGRGVLVNKNFEPEDYPASGYIFNNAARNGVSFKDYGALVRIAGTDTGASTPTTLNDPPSGGTGYPTSVNPLQNVGDVDTQVQGLGQSYFLSLPILSVLGGKNPTGEDRLDHNYPGYNFNISDQRRAKEFIQDFDRMVSAGTLPQFVYLYQPNDHTGGAQSKNVPAPTAAQQVADGDVGLGMVVKHLMQSPVYYNAQSGEGSAIFITYDDAQSSKDHIHTHRTPLMVVSPYAKPGFLATRHYSTASVVKTEELLLGLPPNNLGDLLATDLRDMFQPAYNGITAADLSVTRTVKYQPSPEGRKLWALSSHLDTSAPDRDSYRLGALGRLSMHADRLHRAAQQKGALRTRAYRKEQAALYATAVRLVNAPAPRRDADD